MGQLASLFDEDGAKAALNLRFGFDAKPDDVARDAALAKRFGLPQGVIAEYRPDYETRAKVEDARQMLDQAPKLRGWLAADIKRAELAHDDIGNLTAIEKATRFLGNAGKALAAGVPMFSAGAYAGAAAPFGVADQIIQSLDDAAAFLTGTPRRQIVGTPGPESFLLNEARAAQQSAQRLMPDMTGMGPEERGIYSGLQSAGQNMITLPLGMAKAGGEALMLAAMGITTGGLSYLKGRDAGADPAKSAVFGAADAVAEIVTERYMGAAGLLRNVKAGASTGKLIAYELAKELPGEVTATLWQNFNEWTILNPDKSLADFVLEQPDAIRETIVATLVGGGVQIGAIKGVERTIRMADRQDTKAAEAGTKAMALGELSKLVEAGKLRTRDVETFQELARELTDEGVPAIYIDAQTLNQSGIDLQAVAQAMPSVAAQVERAIATGGDLVIPTPEFLSAVPGQQFAAELIDLARTAPDAMSAAEAKRYMDERGDQLQTEIAKVLDERQQDDAFQASRESVRSYFTEQLNATKRFTPDVNGAYASMLADFYSAQASRLGMAPAELLNRYRLRAAAQAVDGARVMEQGARSIDDVRSEWAASGIDSMMTERDGMIRLSRIVVPDGERGAGRGTAAMQALIRYADATGQSISLSPSTDFGATSRARLVKFYKRFGFIENKGRNRAFTVSDAMYRPASGAVLEQPAYHGTPHRGIDKFSTDKIGTGEGAQAYGWGLYFASKREVAEWYREQLSGGAEQAPRRFFKGQEFQPGTGGYFAARIVESSTLARARKDVAEWIKDAETWSDKRKADKGEQETLRVWREALGILNQADKKSDFTKKAAQGQLYEVEVPDDEHLLLWDKPLSEQPEAVRDALEKLGADDWAFKPYVKRDAAGQELYRYLARENGDKAASEALAAAGIKGIKYLDGTSRRAGEGSYNYVVFSGDDVAITRQFYQGDQQPRAQIAFPQDITQAPSVITLLQGADLSSFIHETGHFFLEVQADLAARIQAQARGGASLTDGERQILADTTTLLDWFGIKGNEQQDALTEWLSMTMEQRREHHEKFARGFEAYAMEGKAPSVELRAIFSRFRAWLVSVYKNLKALNVTLTDDVRAVMDRMLATDAQIADMQAARGMSALFKTAEEAGMTPDEWRAYNDLAAEAVGQAAEYLDARSLRDLKWAQNAKSRALKDLQKQADAIRRETRLRVRAEVMAQPVYRAWQFLTTKDSAAVDEGPNEVEKAYRAELADWEQRRAEFVNEATKLERLRLWDAAPESKLPTSTPLTRGQFISKNRRLIAANVEVEAIAWEQDNPKPVKPEPRQPQQTAPLEEGAGKLSTSALKEMYGNKPDALWRKLSARRMTSDTIGVHPDVVAEAFGGFDSGDAMVKALADAVPPSEVVEAMTDERMLAENGELATPEAIERAADEAVHNEARARFVATEFAALEKANAVREKVPGTRRTVDVLARAAREYAATVVAAMKVRELTAGRFEAAEARAARNAEKAMRSGDMAKAAAEKRAQMIQSAAAKATLEARREMDQARAYFRRFDKRRASIDPDYQDQIEALLERVELRQISDKASARRKSLAAWVEDQRAQGNDPDIPDKLLQESALTSFRDMTVEEVRGLRDTIRQIEHLGRLKNRLLTAREQRDFDAVADEVSQSIVDNGGAARPVVLEGADRGFKPWLEGFAASHRKLSSLIRQMDGGRDDGPLWRFLGRAMNERGTMEDVMTERATVALDAIYAPVMALPGGVNGGKVFIPEIGASLSRGGRLSVLLNWGNEDNRQRIRDGDKWTDTQVQAIIRTLSPVELEFANKVWEFIDGYWPDVAAKQRRVTGVEPEKVQAVPFTATASDGTEVQMRGGYYPLKYDTARSDRAGQQEAAQVYKEMIQGAYTKAQTRKGHTKERLQEVKRPVRKDINVITQHVSQVVHDLAWHEWLLDANKLIGDERISEAIREHYGPAVLKTIRENLQGIATADVVPQTDIDKALLLARSNITRATMGASLTTAFLQPFGLTQSMVRIGPKHVLRGVARWGGDAVRLENTIGWINGKSDFMRLRAKTFNRELREISQQVHGKSKVMRAVDSGLFALTQKMQLVADVPTWVGQYEKTMAEGPAADTDEARAALEAKAIADADRAVIESQGSGQSKDLADVQRKHPMLTQFYSYFSVTLNLTAERTAATDFKNPRAVAGWLGDMALLLVIPALVPAMLMDAMRGGGDDDEESYALKLAKWQAGYLLGMVVGVRELSGIVGGFDYAGPPVARIGVDIGKAAQQTAQGEADEALVLSYARLMGDAFGIPVTQAIRSYKGWKAWDEGEEGAGPQSVLFGPPIKD